MPNDMERADKFDKVRALTAPFIGLTVLLVQQGIYFAWDWGSHSLIQIVVWLAFACAMLVLLLTSGAWLLPAELKPLANDEVTKANRLIAVQAGFVVAMVMGLIVWTIAPFEELHAQRAAHLIASISLGTAFVAFGVAEISSNAR